MNKIICPICHGTMTIFKPSKGSANFQFACNLETEFHVLNIYIVPKTIIQFCIFTNDDDLDFIINYNRDGTVTMHHNTTSLSLDSINLYDINELKLFL